MNNNLPQQLYDLLLKLAEAERQAIIAEEMTKHILAVLTVQERQFNVKTTIAMCEWQAKSSSEYKKAIENMAEKKYLFRIAKAKVEKVKMQFELDRSSQISQATQKKYALGIGD